MSRYLSQPLAIGAFEMVRPAIELNLDGVTTRNAGHLRISALVDGEWATVLTHDFGNRDEWEHDYEGHATGKEKLSQEHGMSSREVHAMYPDLVEPGDTVYYGSVVSPGGTIVVAFSGVEAFFDEMFASWVLAAIMALLQQLLDEQVASGEVFYKVA